MDIADIISLIMYHGDIQAAYKLSCVNTICYNVFNKNVNFWENHLQNLIHNYSHKFHNDTVKVDITEIVDTWKENYENNYEIL